MEFDVGKIFAGIGILIGSVLLVYGLMILCRKQGCRGTAARHNHVLQILLCFLFFIGLLASAFVAFGTEMAKYLITGVGIALGLALQPIMKKTVSGIVFDSTIHAGRFIECGEIKGTVIEVGIVHTWIQENGKDGKKWCVHNEYLDTHPLKICDAKCSKNPTGNSSSDPNREEEPLVLKYW